MKKVLITGMSGLIGGVLRRHLEEAGGYELSALNRRPVEGVKCLQADIADLEAIKPAFEGIDTVVHLAAWVEEEDPFEGNLNASIIGTYNVYEASRLAGVKRVVYASSGMTIRGFPLKVEPYKAIAEGRYEDVPESWPMITEGQFRPQTIYGAAKVFGEALARHYSDAYDISILSVRIGMVHQEDRPKDIHDYATHLSHRDVATILHKCIDASEDLMYDIFFATSKNKWGYRDLEHPKQVLGWEPQDSAEDFR
jgi:nucleoside-diphosphate-sugar epimerase